MSWTVVWGGGALVDGLTLYYHLYGAPVSPVLPYFVGTLIFMPPWQAGVAFLITTSLSTYYQVTHLGVTQLEAGERIAILLVLFALIVYVKERLARRNRERLRLLAERINRRLQAVLDAAPAPMLMVDDAGLIVRANELLEHLSGYSRTELEGQSVELLVPLDRRSSHVRERTAYMVHPRARPMGLQRELNLQTKAGQHIPVLVTLSPDTEADQPRIVAGIVDITLRRTMEQQRLDALRAADAAEMRVKDAERRSSERSAFMSAAAHELRTPLTALHGYAEIATSALLKIGLLSGNGDRTVLSTAYSLEGQRIARALPALLRQTEKMEKLVNLLLDVGRLEQGRLVLDLRQDDLAVLVHEIAQGLQMGDPDHPLNVGGVEGPLLMTFDTMRIEQVLSNLIHNAQQYSPAGQAINIALHVQDGTALLSVSDQGRGIPPEERPLVWDKFYQIGRTERSQGLGLGLFIVKEFVELHNGTAQITEGPGGTGTTVIVTLPLEGTPPAVLDETLLQPRAPGPGSD